MAPSTMKTAPAIRRSQCAGTTLLTPASDIVASCVLSPSSATKIDPKVESRSFQS
jgi:hypothetical protein